MLIQVTATENINRFTLSPQSWIYSHKDGMHPNNIHYKTQSV